MLRTEVEAPGALVLACWTRPGEIAEVFARRLFHERGDGTMFHADVYAILHRDDAEAG